MRPTNARVLVAALLLVGTAGVGWSAGQTPTPTSTPTACPMPSALKEELKKLPLCSPAITNGDCVLLIERDSASSPLPVKLKKGAVATVIVHKRPLDSVTAEATFTDVAAPDPAAALYAAFSPHFKGITFQTDVANLLGRSILGIRATDVDRRVIPARAIPLFETLQWIHERQEKLKTALEVERKDKAELAATALKKFQALTTAETCTWDKNKLSVAVGELKPPLNAAADMETGTGLAKGLREATDAAAKAYAALASPPTAGDLEEVHRILNEVAADQAEIDASSASLVAAATAARDAGKALAELTADNLFFSQSLRGGGRGSRTVVVKLKAEDARKKTIELGAVNVTWAATRWEVSAGAVFSALPNRSFQNTVQIVDGQIQLTPDGKQNTSITETTTAPSIVPIALAHYRLAERAGYDRRWAVLATGGLGISPYSGSTDFAAGITIAYRSLFISPVAHFARDIRLTSGLKTGDSLGAGPPPLPTERFWKTSFGISVSAKVF